MIVYQSNATHTAEQGVGHTVGNMTRLVLSFTLLLSLGTLCHADCCWDSDGYAIDLEEVIRRQDDPIWKEALMKKCDCNPAERRGPQLWDPKCQHLDNVYDCCAYGIDGPWCRWMCKYTLYDGCKEENILRCMIPGSGARYVYGKTYCYDTDTRLRYCLDGTKRVGSYCGVGKCNMFGCDCDGGCRGGKRRLMQAKTNISLPSVASSGSSVSNLVGQCQDKMIDKYNTTSLQEPEQIRAYFDCLDTNSNGMLDGKDASMRNASIDISDLMSLDSDGDGSIDPSEFDTDLSATAADPAAAAAASFSRLSVSFVMVSSVMVCLVAQLV